MKRVIVTGTLAYDYIMDFPGRFADRIMPEKIHKISLSFLVDRLNKQFGGTAGNISFTLKLLGAEPIILSSAGNDFDPYEQFLKRQKITTTHIQKHADVGSSSYFVVTDQDNNQIGSFYIGATKYTKDLSIREHLEGGRPQRSGGHDSFQVMHFVIIAPTDPIAMKKYVKECRSLNLQYLYDPAFQIATFSASDLREGIEGAQILIGNDYEIALIEKTLEISHEELRTMAPIIITTLGNEGSIIETRYESIHVQPAKPKNTSDSTGAGDAFRAGFIAGYLRFMKGLTPDQLLVCGQMGSVAAVYTVEKYGTQTHHFIKREFIARYKENFHSIINL